jgi:hypothetical protein
MMWGEPVYYLGWIICPVLGGYLVYDRQDHSKDTSIFQATLAFIRREMEVE